MVASTVLPPTAPSSSSRHPGTWFRFLVASSQATGVARGGRVGAALGVQAHDLVQAVGAAGRGERRGEMKGERGWVGSKKTGRHLLCFLSSSLLPDEVGRVPVAQHFFGKVGPCWCTAGPMHCGSRKQPLGAPVRKHFPTRAVLVGQKVERVGSWVGCAV